MVGFVFRFKGLCVGEVDSTRRIILEPGVGEGDSMKDNPRTGCW